MTSLVCPDYQAFSPLHRSEARPRSPPIIVHPDVRRMLLTMKAFAEATAVLYFAAKQQVDIVQRSQDEEQKKAADLDAGSSADRQGVHDRSRLRVRQPRRRSSAATVSSPSTAWSRTSATAASRCCTKALPAFRPLDLLGRKVLMTQGEALKGFTKIVHKFCQANEANEAVKEFVAPLAQLNKEWGDLTMKVGMAAMKDREEVGAASVDLMYPATPAWPTSGPTWRAGRREAGRRHRRGSLYKAKLQTARFYFQRILPRTRAHVAAMLSGANNLMEMAEEDFALGY